MYSIEFIKLLGEQQKLYKEFPLPVLVCDSDWEVCWGNDAARQTHAHLTGGEGIRTLLGEFDLRELAGSLVERGAITVHHVLPFSTAGLSLLPIVREGQLRCVICMVVREDDVAGAGELYQSTKTADALSNSMRDAVVENFSAMDLMVGKLNMAEAGWAAEGLNRVALNNYRILRIAGNLSDYARFQSGLMDLSFQPVDLGERVTALCAAAQPLLEDMGVPLEMAPPESALVARVDWLCLERALLNLLHNAAYYTRPGNHILLRVAAKGNNVAVSVEDAGLGIPPDEVDKVLRPYYSYTHGGLARGIGLGLTNAGLCAQAHDGALTLDSKSGRGTRIDITLPREGKISALDLAQPEPERGLSDRFSPLYVALADAAGSPFAAELGQR